MKLQIKDENTEKVPENAPQLANMNRKKRATPPKIENYPQPYFLSWLIDCLEIEGNENSVTELVKNVTYEEDNVLTYVMTSPENVTPLDQPVKWKNFKEQIISKNYHTNFGDCLTVDIESLSENNGKFPISSGSDKTTVELNINMEDHIPDHIPPSKDSHEFIQAKMKQPKHYLFLHDNSANVEQLGVNIKGRQFWGDIRDTQEVILHFSIL